MKYLLKVGLLLCVCASAIAMAETTHCNDNSTQMELNQCSWNDYQAADKKLNAAWKQLMVKFKDNKTATEKLKTSQKAWLTFRDAEVEATFACAPNTGPCWGSIEPLLRNNELQVLTESRTKRLQTYLKDGLGVVSDN